MGRCCVIRGYVWALYEGVFREMSLFEELLGFQNDADVQRAIQESENDGVENDAQDAHQRLIINHVNAGHDLNITDVAADGDCLIRAEAMHDGRELWDHGVLDRRRLEIAEQEYMDAVSSVGVDAADRDARLSRAKSIRDRNNVRGVVLEEPALHAMARLRKQIIVVSGASGTLTLTLLFSEDISISIYLPGYM